MAEVNGTKLYYETAGKEPAVVLAHGGLVDSRLWNDQMKEFAKHHRVVRYDLRGFGRSAAAHALGISFHTVSFHLKNIYYKLQVHSKTEAVAKALREKLV